MSTSMDPRQQAIVDEFALFSDWTERYQYLIDLGKTLDALPEDERHEAWLVPGCQSRVWLLPQREGSRLQFRAASDSAIVSGLVALLLRVYSDREASEILATEPGFIEAIGLGGQLSPTRKNGLHAMLAKIRDYARMALGREKSPEG